MTRSPNRGDVWIVNLGMVAKVRPCLVISVAATDDNDRVLTTVLPCTTSLRGSRFEVATTASFLKPGAVDAQQLTTIPTVKLVKRLGTIPLDQFAAIESAVRIWLQLP